MDSMWKIEQDVPLPPANSGDKLGIHGPTRNVALAEGIKKYFTGVPCHQGHVCERWTANASCVECQKARLNPEKVRLYNKRWKTRNPESAIAVRYRHHYGVELSEIRPKPDTCEVCGEKHWKIVFDHCHDSGTFRGWLCNSCNLALGYVKEKVETLELLADYLRNHRERRG